jgi:hypothetical protein
MIAGGNENASHPRRHRTRSRRFHRIRNRSTLGGLHEAGVQMKKIQRIEINLKIHSILMERNMLAGESREAASQSAMRELRGMTIDAKILFLERHLQ